MDEITRELLAEALDVRARSHACVERSKALRRRSEEIRRQSSRLRVLREPLTQQSPRKEPAARAFGRLVPMSGEQGFDRSA
jgi:hypothetical protein